MPAPGIERRRVQRVKLIPPLRGTIGEHRMFVLDVSVTGLRIAHQESVGAAGHPYRVSFDWDGQKIDVFCDLQWTSIQRNTSTSAKPVYHSGLSLRDVKTTSAGVLRELVLHHVARALDEQKANARGIPPAAANSYQTGTSTEFVRHQLIGETWRETLTTDPRQPITGFTIAAGHPSSDVAMLRSAYAAGDPAAREAIRQMAALTLDTSEGVPARRYMP
jgi:hypothetical protein